MSTPANVPSDRHLQPLLGRRVMVTRPEMEKGTGPICAKHPTGRSGKLDLSPFSDPLAKRLQELGAEVIVQPAIRIGPPPDWRAVDDALARLDQFDWLVFSSVNGAAICSSRSAASVSM